MVTTEAIILGWRPYSDSMLLLDLFTATHGRNTFALHGNKYRNLLFYLNIVSVSYVPAPNKSLWSIRGMESTTPLYTLSSDVIKECMTMFIAEVLRLSLPHPQEDPQLFSWLKTQITQLDQHLDTHWHINVMMGLSRLLGYQIERDSSSELSLQELCNFFRMNVPGFKYTPKSLAVLHNVLH